ncbi:hypothetical protein [Rhizobium multihospitium]|uniref:Uncharacterized protein n=1 Tax=Rhizobium multihospitium TaxID=410764 RepID=A0A1C3WX80_9HYPH|nr:hypothetical protein [Rhizobium multihospitium]SCB44344.1 hypothetical protein GA0061103_6461 [Rhizobium multihospitium]
MTALEWIEPWALLLPKPTVSKSPIAPDAPGVDFDTKVTLLTIFAIARN